MACSNSSTLVNLNSLILSSSRLYFNIFMVKTSSHGGYFTFEISLRLQRVQSGGQILCFYKSRFSTIFFNAARTGESSGRRTVGFPSQSYS